MDYYRGIAGGRIGDTQYPFNLGYFTNLGSDTVPVTNGYFTNLFENGTPVATTLDVSGAIANMATTNTDQVISGAKTFTGTLTTRSIVPDVSSNWNLGTSTNPYWFIYGQYLFANQVGSTNLPISTGYFDNLYKGGVGVSTVDDIAALQTQIDELKAEIEALKTKS